MSTNNEFPPEVKLDRPINLAGAIALVIGGVIGMGIYALIAEVGAQAGTSLWLAMTIAIGISIIGVTPLIQLASALPRAGGGYLFTSRLLNPMLGTIVSSWALIGGACMSAVVSIGLSEYIVSYLPFEMPVKLLAVILPGFFFLLYFIGLRLAASIQVILVAQLIIALVVYGILGLLDISGDESKSLDFSINFPQGTGGFIFAIIIAYSVCMGFQVIAEMGEEMVNAKRNIPLALIIGGIVILILYIIVGMVFTNSIPYDFDSISQMKAPLKETGEKFLPNFWVVFLSVGAISAGMTSFNAGAIALPREFFSLARDQIAPSFLGKIDKRTKSPINAVAVFFLIVIILIIFGQNKDFYGIMTAVGILLMTAVLSIAAVRLPDKYPDRYQSAYFKIPKILLIIISIVAVLSCLGFVAAVIMQMYIVGIIYIIWTGLIILYYVIRVNRLKKSGVDLKKIMSRIPGFDE